jgi:DNA mismatch repair protein MutS
MPPTSAESPNLDTPLMKQYQALKARYPHALLFFRLGDFYELFADDAKKAAPILGLVLTHRQGLPMCGVPHHSSGGYIAKLLKAGQKVALAEQMEEPSKGKGLVDRQVIRLITPGTLIEDELLEAARSNYLAAVEIDTVGWGLACLEASTGEFWAAQAFNDAGLRQLEALLARLEPAEIVGSEASIAALRSRTPMRHYSVTAAPMRTEPSEHWAEREKWANKPLAVKAALRAERYIQETEPHLKSLFTPRYREPHSTLQLDEAAIRTLELVSSPSGDRRHTLWGALDRCRTAMGSRKLKDWILHPLLDTQEIEKRLACVEELIDGRALREEWSVTLGETADLERVVHRLATPSSSPKDLAALRDTLSHLPELFQAADLGEGSGLARILAELRELSGRLAPLHRVLSSGLSDSPPNRLSDGGVIRDGHHPELDELRSIKSNSKGRLLELEAAEKERTGIPNLKIGYNSVFGYYLEVTKSHQSKAPPEWSRKQTLANAERYITPQLKQLESKVLGAEERIARLETQLFDGLKREALARHSELSGLAARLAELDVYLSLATVAFEYDYVKPRVDVGHDLELEDARHPMVERGLPAGQFVPNHLTLNGVDPQIIVLTGPNMSGKSTFLRQNALVVLMAQMGSFVPARSARIGVVDRILTRIGAQDALSRGESTFMVEMKETAFILAQATPRSLIILDEVGRGTSTFDGISIAQAVLEHLHTAYRRDGTGPGPKVLFATHYFELTELQNRLAGVRNFNVEAREWTNSDGRTEVVFLHKIAPGPADRSYGIHVAELAGLPASCVARARKILAGLETAAPEKPIQEAAPLLPIFNEHPVLDELKLSTPEKMTPLEAFDKLIRWKRMI